MTYPYSISSDQHCHEWSQFAQVGKSGINSRLQAILNELARQAVALKKTGGDTIYLAGDLFHVRGRISPETLNPTMDTFRSICSKGIKVRAIAGNHDLTGKTSERLGNAMQALGEIDGFEAIVDPVDYGAVKMIPWIEDLDELRAVMKSMADRSSDLIIHAPLNGVIKGIPANGLSADEVSKMGFKRVFIGHYHNFQNPAPGVYSIGATTHQTWSDPGTKAGFLMIEEDTVTHHPTTAPLFVDYFGGDIDEPELYDGNFVRMRMDNAEEAVIKQRREELRVAGAKGIVDHSSRKRSVTRSASVKTNVSLNEAVNDYVQDHYETKLDKDTITTRAQAVLKRAQEGSE